MTDKPKKLSETARALLTAAATRDDHLIRPPRLPTAAARQVIRSLLNAGWAEEVPAPFEAAAYAWRQTADGTKLMLRATMLGRTRVGADKGSMPAALVIGTAGEIAAEMAVTTETDADEARRAVAPLIGHLPVSVPQASQEAENPLPNPQKIAPAAAAPAGAAQAATAAPVRAGHQDPLRQAVRAFLDARDRPANAKHKTVDAMNGPIAALRVALAARGSVSASIASSCPPRNTKQAQVLAMLGRDQGASGPQIAQAMGWAPHTVRGFLAGLAKRGVKVEALERIRQLGPHKAGAKGSYTIYRLADAAEG